MPTARPPRHTRPLRARIRSATLMLLSVGAVVAATMSFLTACKSTGGHH